MNQNCKSVFLYNENDELITFVDITEDNKIVNFYDLRNRKLIKINKNQYFEYGKEYTETNRAIIVFSEDSSLFHTFLDGESRVVAQKSNSHSREQPTIISKIHNTNNDNTESFTINKDLVNTWLKKAKL
jgi:hypothetical protein